MQPQCIVQSTAGLCSLASCVPGTVRPKASTSLLAGLDSSGTRCRLRNTQPAEIVTRRAWSGEPNLARPSQSMESLSGASDRHCASKIVCCLRSTDHGVAETQTNHGEMQRCHTATHRSFSARRCCRAAHLPSSQQQASGDGSLPVGGWGEDGGRELRCSRLKGARSINATRMPAACFFPR